MDSIMRMKELTELLNKASKAYYMQDSEIMSNLEYDALYDELLMLEEKTGTVLSNSPSIHVGYEVVSSLPKVEHEYPMLSLDKTKSVDTLADWMGDRSSVLSWKLDGLTVVLTYQNGELYQAVTRGNGTVGEDITANARAFMNVPHKIAFKGKLTLRGEALIRYSDFNIINSRIPEGEEKYKNPRNLCSGSVRQLNSEITASRNVYFMAFFLVEAEGIDFDDSRVRQFEWMSSQGFDVVEYQMVDRESIAEAVASFSERISDNDFPSDGLVLMLNDIAYGESLGTTAKFPRNAIAFKWADELKETKLIEVEWSASRTGLINPVAVFEPVELEGTTVSRASLHNVSILKALQLGVGDELQVYKANMIIPQIAENNTRSDTLEIPKLCPVCGQETHIHDVNGVASLYCLNPACEAKQIKLFGHFVSRDAFNVDGLSEQTLEKLIAAGLIHEYADLFHLDRHKDVIVDMEGFGERSYAKLMEALEKARHISVDKLIYSLGIANIGLSNAKLICRQYKDDLKAIIGATAEELIMIDGIGQVIADSMVAYFADEDKKIKLEHLLAEIILEKNIYNEDVQILSGKTFVITGSVHIYKNRNELKARIESLGGKVAGSVSQKTSYLINNDTTSSSAKNKKARELGIPILSEEDFQELAGLE